MLKVYQISANLVHRELRNAIFVGGKVPTSITFPDSVLLTGPERIKSRLKAATAAEWNSPRKRKAKGRKQNRELHSN